MKKLTQPTPFRRVWRLGGALAACLMLTGSAMATSSTAIDSGGGAQVTGANDVQAVPTGNEQAVNPSDQVLAKAANTEQTQAIGSPTELTKADPTQTNIRSTGADQFRFLKSAENAIPLDQFHTGLASNNSGVNETTHNNLTAKASGPGEQNTSSATTPDVDQSVSNPSGVDAQRIWLMAKATEGETQATGPAWNKTSDTDAQVTAFLLGNDLMHVTATGGSDAQATITS